MSLSSCVLKVFFLFAQNALKLIHFTCRVPQIKFPSARLPKWKGGKLKTILSFVVRLMKGALCLSSYHKYF